MVTESMPSRIPEPGSFRHRILAQPSSYLRPIQWGPELLDHIDCDVLPRFTSTDDSNSSTSTTTTTIPAVEDDRIVGALERLNGAPPVRRSKDEAARVLFRLLVPTDQSAFELSSISPQLLFNGKPVASTPSPLLFRSTATSRPIFAFVDKTWLSDQRYKGFQHKAVNVAYKTVQKMAKLEFDPYIAALLLAMAQNSCSSTSDHEIQVYVFSPSTDRKSFIQYSSNVSRQYLRKWENAYEASGGRVTIAQKEIPWNRPDVIMQILRELQRLYTSSGALVSTQKRRVMSDITNHADNLPATKRIHQ